MSSKYDIYAPVVNLLNSQHKTDKEIERIIGVDSRRISDIRKRNNIIRVYPSETPLKFTNLEYQLLIGGLVGDLCIFKDKKSIYHRFSFAHSTKQKSYFLLKYNLLKRFLSKPTERSWHDKRTNNVYEEIKTQSFTHKLFSELYEKWYVEGRKIIHDDIWNLDEIGLATIYFDDGYVEGYGHGISLDSYTKEDIYKLYQVLTEKFDLKCTTPKHGRSIYIKSESAEKFKKLVQPLVTKNTKYKI